MFKYGLIVGSQVPANNHMHSDSKKRRKKGHEGNWIQILPGKSYNVLLRLYGPQEPWFDKTWKPGDFELVK